MVELRDTAYGKKISSRDLYNKIIASQKRNIQYLRWVRLNIETYGIFNVDYFEGPKIITRRGPVSDVLLSVEMARSLCFINRTKRALEIREWLFENELTCTT